MRASFLLLSAALAAPLFPRGTLAGQSSPAAPVPPRGVVTDLRFTSIAAGGSHSCGLTAEGRAYCWGRNNAGQLGDSTTTDRATPVPVVGGLTFLQISTGGEHTCAVSSDDEPLCWGGNQHGQLGTGTRGNTPHPRRVGGESGKMRAVQIAAGGSHTCMTQKHWDKQHRAMCWGKNDQGQLGTMTPGDAALPGETFGVIQYLSIAAGDLHSCGATEEGKVFCWGANVRGQLGNGSITFSRVPFLTRMNRREKFTQVVAGGLHTCALTTEREVYCWGENTDGQVGNGKTGGRVLFPALLRDSLGFTGVVAGGASTCALRPDGSAACWGSNRQGQFGTPASSRRPSARPGPSRLDLEGHLPGSHARLRSERGRGGFVLGYPGALSAYRSYTEAGGVARHPLGGLTGVSASGYLPSRARRPATCGFFCYCRVAILEPWNFEFQRRDGIR